MEGKGEKGKREPLRLPEGCWERIEAALRARRGCCAASCCAMLERMLLRGSMYVDEKLARPRLQMSQRSGRCPERAMKGSH